MRRVAVGLLVVAGYAAFVLYLTWPLARYATSHLPDTTVACGFDNLYSAWALAHQSTALFTDPAQLAQGNNFYPTPDSLYYGPTGYGALPYFAPVFLATGNPTLALNVLLYVSIVLTAAALHLVVRHWSASHLAGAVAAAVYLFTRWTLWQWLPTTPHASVLAYFPLIILLAATPATGLRRNLALLALVLLQCLTELVYVAPAVLAPLAVLGLIRLTRPQTRSAGAILLGIVAVSGMVLLIPAWGHLRVGRAMPNLARHGFWKIDAEWFREHGTEIPLGLFDTLTPTAIPGAALAMLCVYALSSRARAHRAARPLALWGGLGVLMSLTPSVRFGDYAVDLPQAYLAKWVPFFGQIRVPSRLGVAALMSFAMLAGLAYAALARQVDDEVRSRAWAPVLKAALAVAVIGLMYIEYLAYLPTFVLGEGVMRRYRIEAAPALDVSFSEILRQPGGPLLELPAHLDQKTGSPTVHVRAMYRSIFHGRAVLNGYASYWPPGFAERMALAARLPDPAALAALQRETGLALVWVHLRDFPRRLHAPWMAFADAGGRDDLRLIARDGDELLFATTP